MNFLKLGTLKALVMGITGPDANNGAGPTQADGEAGGGAGQNSTGGNDNQGNTGGGNNNNNGGRNQSPDTVVDEFGNTVTTYPPGHDLKTVTMTPDGDRRSIYSNGDVENSYTDGRSVFTTLDGDVYTTNADGSLVIETGLESDNGDYSEVTVEISVDGKTITTSIDGIEQMNVTEGPMGMPLTTYPDGTTTHYEQLTIYDPTYVITDPHGNQTRYDITTDEISTDINVDTGEYLDVEGITLTERPPFNPNSDNEQNTSPPANNTSPVSSVNPQGFPVITFPEGHTITNYPNQLVVLQNLNGGGTVIHPELGEQSFPSGSSVSMDANGSLIVSTEAAGSIEFTEDNSIITIDERGHTTTEFEDGSRLYVAEGQRTNYEQSNGLRISDAEGVGVLYNFADGSLARQNSSGVTDFSGIGKESFLFHPDGRVIVSSVYNPYQPSTVITVETIDDGQGYSVQETSEGSHITSYDSGLRVIETAENETGISYPDGAMFVMAADGATTFIGTDGTSVHVSADGTEYTNGIITGTDVEPMLASPHANLENHSVPSGEVYDPESFDFEIDVGEFWNRMEEFNGGHNFQATALDLNLDINVAGDSFLQTGFNNLGLSPIMQVRTPITNQDLEGGATNPSASEAVVAINKISGQDFTP